MPRTMRLKSREYDANTTHYEGVNKRSNFLRKLAINSQYGKAEYVVVEFEDNAVKYVWGPFNKRSQAEDYVVERIANSSAHTTRR